MNEINTMADQGEFERCEGCGVYVHTTMMLPVMIDKKEIVACLGCHVEHGRLSM